MVLYKARICISGIPQCLRDAASPAIRLSTSMTPSSPQFSTRMIARLLRHQYAEFCQVRDRDRPNQLGKSLIGLKGQKQAVIESDFSFKNCCSDEFGNNECSFAQSF